MGEVTDATRRVVLARDDYQCVARGQLPGECSGHLDMGHLIGRGIGGSDLYDTAAWLTTQCRRHNGDIEDVPETRAMAIRLGLKIERKPGLIPVHALVRYPDRVWYLLINTTKERADREYPWLVGNG